MTVVACHLAPKAVDLFRLQKENTFQDFFFNDQKLETPSKIGNTECLAEVGIALRSDQKHYLKHCAAG